MQRSLNSIEASLKVVNVLGILDQKHGFKYVTVNGRREKRCLVAPTMTCEEHFKIADYAHLNGVEGKGQVLVAVFNSLGKNPTKPVGNPGGEGYVKIVEEALSKIEGPTIWKPDYDRFMAQMENAKEAERRRELHRSIEILLKASKDPIEKLAKLADRRVQEINEQGDLQVAEAENRFKEDPAKSKETLRRVAQDYDPLACSKRAAELLKKLGDKGR